MLGIKISFNTETMEIETSLTDEREYRKRNKGKSILAFPEEYTIVDIETTGLDPEYDEIIEICAVKVRNGNEVERFASLVKPQNIIDEFISNLTGITNEMLENAPPPDEVIPYFVRFISNDILVAHNAHFDINFLYDYVEKYLSIALQNNFICTMRLARRVFPAFTNHKLSTLCECLNINLPTHRAASDAKAAWSVYERCKTHITEEIGLESFLERIRNSSSYTASGIKPSVDKFDCHHPAYGKIFVFTGTLSKMVRKEAMQLVVDLGGICSDGVTKKTDYLVMGIQDYSKFADGEKSSKTIKAEKLILQKHDITIISENNFYDLVLEKNAL